MRRATTCPTPVCSGASSDRREVGWRYVPGDLVQALDLMGPELLRVLVDHVLVRRAVDAVRRDVPLAVDDHVTVLPGDLREVAFDDLAGAPTDVRHLGLAHG